MRRCRTLRGAAQKPLDQSLRDQETFIHIGLARKRALAKRWDEGRDQFRAAEELSPDLCNQYSFLARKVLFEAKASERDQSDRYLKEAQAALDEPTPLWMVLAIESVRYEMSAATKAGYAELWSADLKKKCQSRTAGEMALTLHTYMQAGVDYSGRSGHVNQLTAYLKRTTRIKYRQIDIEHVCAFLSDLPAQRGLLGKLLKLGLEAASRIGGAQLRRQGSWLLPRASPRSSIPMAKKHLEKALKLAEASTAPTETALLPTIKSATHDDQRAQLHATPICLSVVTRSDFQMQISIPSSSSVTTSFDDDFWPAPSSIPRKKPKAKKKPKKR